MIERSVKSLTGSKHAFMNHPIFGLINTCPSNLGTGLRASVHIAIPRLLSVWGFDKVNEMCRGRNCQARGSDGEHSQVLDRVDISNSRRVGVPEYVLIEDMISCVNWLAEQESNLNNSWPCFLQ